MQWKGGVIKIQMKVITTVCKTIVTFINSSSENFLNYNKIVVFLWDNLQVKQLRDTKNKAMKYDTQSFNYCFIMN